MKIGLISDTHSYFDPQIPKYFSDRDEIWHAGDIGDLEVIDKLEKLAPVQAVYGNIDNEEVRARFPLNLSFEINNVKVFITHIGGYPGRYTKRVKDVLNSDQPDLYICGHSHILKIVRDQKLKLLHMNPGAAGIHGFHRIKTLIRFEITLQGLQNVEVIELGKRGAIN